MDRKSRPPRAPRPDASLRFAAFAAYGIGLVVLGLAFWLRTPQKPSVVYALPRGLERGEVGPELPRLEPSDPMANAAVLNTALEKVPNPGFASAGSQSPRCLAAARNFALLIDGRLSRVRFGPRAVCQLQRLKQISVAQPGFGPHGVAEVAAFVLGRRLAGTDDVDVSRVLVPPFRFAGDSLTFEAADLGALSAGELLIGTYHTHPEDDLAQGVLSETDLDYFRSGVIDFAGQVGSLARPTARLDWLFDIVDPRDGGWNVYAHDGRRLAALGERCKHETPCPLNELRLAGSAYHLLTRVYEERDEELP